MGISRLTAFCGIHGGQFLTLRIKSALALSEGGTGGTMRAGRAPDAFEVTLPRLFAFGFGCGGFVLGEAFMADHRVELSGKFPANGFLRGWIVIEMIED